MTARVGLPRRLRRARVLGLAVMGYLLVLPAGAQALGTIDPIPGLEQSAPCIGDTGALEPLTRGVSPAQRALGFTEVWDLSRGSGVTVAVIDTGVNPLAAFGGRVRSGGDLLWKESPRPGLMDCDGHGTVVAGIIAAAPNLRTGFAGVAPEATVLSIRQTSTAYRRPGRAGDAPSGPEGVGTAATLASAIDLAVEQGARVVNVSGAYCTAAVEAESGPLRAAVRRAVAADVVVVAAAGNVSSSGACSPQNTPGALAVTAATPARVPEALTVGSVKPDGTPSEFSLAGEWVDLAAPGEGVISVNPHPDGSGEVGALVTSQGTVPLEGTSYAAPYVAGVAALVRARFPQLTAAQVIQRLVVTAGRGAGVSPRSIAVGAGMVDPARALSAVLPEEGAAGRPLPLEQQHEAGSPAASTGPSGSPKPGSGTGVEPMPRPSALTPLPPPADPFAGRAAALGLSAGLLGLLGLAVVHRRLRRARRRALNTADSAAAPVSSGSALGR